MPLPMVTEHAIFVARFILPEVRTIAAVVPEPVPDAAKEVVAHPLVVIDPGVPAMTKCGKVNLIVSPTVTSAVALFCETYLTCMFFLQNLLCIDCAIQRIDKSVNTISETIVDVHNSLKLWTYHVGVQWTWLQSKHF